MFGFKTKDRDWGPSYFMISSFVNRMIVAWISIASLVAVFVNILVEWYYPIIPFLLYLLARHSHKVLLERYLAARTHEAAAEFSSRGLNEIQNKYYDAAVNKVYNESSGGEIIYKEMFSAPRNVKSFLVEIVGIIAQLVYLTTLTFYSVFGIVTFIQFLLIYGICIFLNQIYRQIRARMAFYAALKRWRSEYITFLNENPDLRQKIYIEHELNDNSIQEWIEAQIVLLIRNKIHPDHIGHKWLSGQSPEKLKEQ